LKASNAEGALPGDAQGGDLFGYGLALSADGNTTVVGAAFEDGDFRSQTAQGNVDIRNNSAPNAGAAHVFTRSGANTWNQPAHLKASNAGAGDEFGSAIAASSDGNVVAIGAFEEDGTPADDGSPNNDHDGLEESGAVYVFARNGTSWSQQSYL